MRTIRFLLIAAFTLLCCSAEARQTYNFNSGWRIDNQKKTVTLPHAWNEDDAFRVSSYEMSEGVVWYRKEFSLDKIWPAQGSATTLGKKVLIEFEGARVAADVYLNGHHVGLHENGVMAFGFDITPYLKKGKNLIEVKTDNHMDYREKATNTKFHWNSKAFFANYGGLSKNVWLHVTDAVYQTLPLLSSLGTTGVYVYGKDYAIPEHTATICVESQVKNETDKPVKRSLNVVVKEKDGSVLCTFKGAETTIPAHGMVTLKAEKRQGGLHFWSWGYGYLYDVITYLSPSPSPSGRGESAPSVFKSSSKGIAAPLSEGEGQGERFDVVTTQTGFRKTEFKNGMIYLNDRVIMVHGYAQRSTNEWPGVGACVPAWLSDYSNDLFVKSGGNVVRWMHVTPWKQDIESCDRVGLIEAMPGGDAEHDVTGRRWVQRLELMRDAIVYNKNNPSILFYECGNQRITGQHMIEMKNLRNEYDPYGGRAIGCREMLDQPEAEYGGEMLYINKSDTKPMWMMEYCRDEANRLYWNSWSYPYHKEGDGPLYRGDSAKSYNHNNDEFVVECVRRWNDYYNERPGTGTMVNSGGVKIVFSDTQTHGRSAANYRVSGVVDPMRIKKDAFYAHQVMWDGWVDDLKPHTYIVGHWQYDKGFVVPTVYVVSNADSVVLRQNGKTIKADSHDYHFLWTFKDVPYEAENIEAISYDKNGNEVSRDEKFTAGSPDHLKLTTIENPTGWKADGADVALVQVEVVDKDGRRCPLDDRTLKWSVKGPAEYRGGVAENKPYGQATNRVALESKSLDDHPDPDLANLKKHCNHVLSDTLPVECGVNRVMLRSLTKAGKITVTAKAEGLPTATINLATQPVKVEDGLTTFMLSDGLKPVLDRGETPSTPSFTQTKENVYIIDVKAGSNQQEAYKSFDRYEDTGWTSAAVRDSAWITYTLTEPTKIDEVCLKMNGFRNTSYPIAIYADSVEVWRGTTEKSLGFVRLPLRNCPVAQKYTIRLVGNTSHGDAFGAVKELDARNDEKVSKSRKALKITEVEFIRKKK